MSQAREAPSSTSTPRRASFVAGPAIGIAGRRLFGSFVEHLGRGVYGGIFEPGHPSATADGFRGDVLELVRELGVQLVRYPGGNFVSGYDWRDGIGPRSDRPARLDLAWKSIESNEFGTDEFAAWCAAAGVEPMLAVNLGLGDIRSALQLLEYVNHPSGTALSDERVRNGAPEPYGVRLWCLGNELDGPWQLGFRTAEEYGELAARTAAAMRMFDPELELVAVGSSHPRMDTFGTWESTVLRRTIELVDHISCHVYFYNDGDLPAFLRSSEQLDRYLDDVTATIRAVKAATRSTREITISLDEWNVWNYPAHDALAAQLEFESAPPLLEDEYTLADAVVVGTLLQSLLDHADVVSIAAMAQLVNVIGPIRAEPDRPAWRQTTFHPFAAVARSVGHTVLRAVPGSDDVASIARCTITRSPDHEAVLVHLANLAVDASAELEIDLGGLGATRVVRAELLWHPDPLATNTAAHPQRVEPVALPASLDRGRLRVALPALSWASIEVSCRSGE